MENAKKKTILLIYERNTVFVGDSLTENHDYELKSWYKVLPHFVRGHY